MHETTFRADLFREKAENLGRGEHMSWQYGRIVSWLWQSTQGLGSTPHKIKKKGCSHGLLLQCARCAAAALLEEAFG